MRILKILISVCEWVQKTEVKIDQLQEEYGESLKTLSWLFIIKGIIYLVAEQVEIVQFIKNADTATTIAVMGFVIINNLYIHNVEDVEVELLEEVTYE